MSVYKSVYPIECYIRPNTEDQPSIEQDAKKAFFKKTFMLTIFFEFNLNLVLLLTTYENYRNTMKENFMYFYIPLKIIWGLFHYKFGDKHYTFQNINDKIMGKQDVIQLVIGLVALICWITLSAAIPTTLCYQLTFIFCYSVFIHCVPFIVIRMVIYLSFLQNDSSTTQVTDLFYADNLAKKMVFQVQIPVQQQLLLPSELEEINRQNQQRTSQNLMEGNNNANNNNNREAVGGDDDIALRDINISFNKPINWKLFTVHLYQYKSFLDQKSQYKDTIAKKLKLSPSLLYIELPNEELDNIDKFKKDIRVVVMNPLVRLLYGVYPLKQKKLYRKEIIYEIIDLQKKLLGNYHPKNQNA